VAEVREQGPTSWQIRIDQPETLIIALFVRDVARLKSRNTWLPHCVPDVAGDTREGSAAAAHEWDLWWDRSIFDTVKGPDQSQDPLARMGWFAPGFESLQSAPALQELVARHFDEARLWAADRRQEHIELMVGTPDTRPFHRARRGGRGLDETRFVAGLERELGRPAQPFRLWITVIPVAGKELWQFDPDHVLLTVELLRDSAEYRARITPVVKALL
jgi:hypothetical protein